MTTATPDRLARITQVLRPFLAESEGGGTLRVGARGTAGGGNGGLRFAAIPSARRPRALLPLPIRASERAVMLKPTTSRMSAKQRLARAVVEACPPAVLGAIAEQVEVDLPSSSELLDALRATTPGARIAVAVSPGAPHRPAFHAFDPDGRLVAVGKFAPSDGRGTIAHEHEMLRTLARVERLAGTVPGVLAFVQTSAGSTLITDAFVGDPAPLDATPAVLEWLRRCETGPAIPLAGAPIVVRTLDEIRRNGDARTVEIAAAALRLAGDATVSETIVHGDFVPWNIIVAGGEPRVFDWEFGCMGGVPGWDRLHFELQVCLVKRDGSAAALLDAITRTAAGDRVSTAVALLVAARLAAWHGADSARGAALKSACGQLLS